MTFALSKQKKINSKAPKNKCSLLYNYLANLQSALQNEKGNDSRSAQHRRD